MQSGVENVIRGQIKITLERYRGRFKAISNAYFSKLPMYVWPDLPSLHV